MGAFFSVPGGPVISEDCLTLNIAVRRPKLNTTATAAQPTLVWLYGGAYDNGDANTYAPGAMVGDVELPIVVVTLNYRMNVFGFLGSKALAARSPDGSTGTSVFKTNAWPWSGCETTLEPSGERGTRSRCLDRARAGTRSFIT